jgi:hypothetical protein
VRPCFFDLTHKEVCIEVGMASMGSNVAGSLRRPWRRQPIEGEVRQAGVGLIEVFEFSDDCRADKPMMSSQGSSG